MYLKKEFLEKKKATKFLRNSETTRSKRKLDLSKKQLLLLTGFLTGHSRLKRHLLRVGLSYTDGCRFCGEEEETPIHLVTECFGIASLRRECIAQETCKSEKLASLKPSQILDFIRSLELEGEL